MPNFIIPEKIEVGYQKRTDTYTEKLAFVTYKDYLGNLQSEKSWEKWRDNTIAPNVFDNVPTEGFVLNKNSGRQWGHFERAEFVRIYDPRGFEFEISTDNLMQIILYNGISKGNGIEGNLVYGWDYGKRKVSLVPDTCPDYAKHLENKKVVESETTKIFTAKTDKVVIGNKYKLKDNKVFTYLGRVECFDYSYDSEPNKVKGHIFKGEPEEYRSGYVIAKNFGKLTHDLGKDNAFEEIYSEFLHSPHCAGFPGEMKKLDWESSMKIRLGEL